MKLNGLTIAAVVLLLLAGGLYWSNHHKPADATTSTDTPPKILSLGEADIAKVDLKKRTGEEVVLSRDASGKW
jgi:hypothetical protein